MHRLGVGPSPGTLGGLHSFTDAMEINAPYGYRAITPLLREMKVRGPTDTLPLFVREHNSVPITVGELPYAGHEYPICFTPGRGENQFVMIAILGLSQGENLFVSHDRWMPRAYVPAYVRRHPYCINHVVAKDPSQDQKVVCIEQDFITPDGISNFDANGQPTELWKQTLSFLTEFEADLGRTFEVCEILSDFKLLEPLSMQARAGEETSAQNGIFRVDITRLDHLTTSQLKTLLKKGALAAIYQHLASLTRFHHLADLKAATLPVSIPDELTSSAHEHEG